MGHRQVVAVLAHFMEEMAEAALNAVEGNLFQLQHQVGQALAEVMEYELPERLGCCQ